VGTWWGTVTDYVRKICVASSAGNYLFGQQKPLRQKLGDRCHGALFEKYIE
jgi:hypothetical protein